MPHTQKEKTFVSQNIRLCVRNERTYKQNFILIDPSDSPVAIDLLVTIDSPEFAIIITDLHVSIDLHHEKVYSIAEWGCSFRNV